MFKKVIGLIAICVSMTSIAGAKDYRLTSEELRLSTNSTIESISDFKVCVDAQRQLRDIVSVNYKKYKTHYPHLNIPVVEKPLYIRLESSDLMRLKFNLRSILYNPNNNTYMYFQCDSFLGGDTKWSQEKFVETLTIEQVQQEIDKAYSEYLTKKNARDSEVNRILGR